MPSFLKYYALLCFCCLIYSCGSKQFEQSEIEGKNYLEKVKKNMSKDQLIQQAGKPDTIVDLGRVTDEHDYTQHLELYFYGSNQSVTLINDTVDALDFNIRKTETRIQHKIDSAKAALQ